MFVLGYPKYFISILAFPLSLSFAMLFSLICLTRSRVSPSWSPISSRPFSWHPIPKHSRMMVISRSFRTLLSTVFSSSAIDSWSTTRSVRLSSPLGITSSMQLSSPSWKGASMLTWWPSAASDCPIFSSSSLVISDSSDTEGWRWFSCSNLFISWLILLSEPTWFNGRRTMRLCSAMAWRMLWRIHHTAYEMNLNPRVSSNFCAALIRPILPSSIKSVKVSPWCWYCFATDTTKRKLAVTSLFFALSPSGPPFLIFWASSISSSIDINGARPISTRYLSKASLERLVMLF